MTSKTINYCFTEVVICLFMAALLLSTLPSHAANIHVNALPNAVGCDLIDAILSANNNSSIGGCTSGSVGIDTITFAPEISQYEFMLEIGTSRSVTPVIDSEIEIIGPENGLLSFTQSSVLSRFFLVGVDGDLSLENISLQGGGATTGGAIRVNGKLSLNNVEIVGSTASFGAGLWVVGGEAIIRNSLFRNNNSLNQGGGIGISNASRVTIYDSSFSGNSADEYGGGISLAAAPESELFMYNTTITENTAGISGGGVSLFFDIPAGQTEGNSAVIRNSIISGNTAPDFSEVFFTNQSLAINLDIRNNLLGTNSSTYSESVNSLIFLSSDTNNIIATPFFENTPLRSILGGLSDNGGQTMTHALVENSPAIDNGLPFYVTLVVFLPIFEPGCRGELAAFSAGEYRTDQRNIDRPIGAECDIGAFEYQPTEESCYVAKAKNNNVFTFCL